MGILENGIGARSTLTYNIVAVGLTLVLGLWGTYTAWSYVHEDEEAETRSRFEFRVTQLIDTVRGRLADQEELLRGVAALFAASDYVERSAWRAYVGSLDLERRYPGTQAMGFALRVSAGDKDVHERRVKADGFPQYAIYPQGARPEYVPVVYVEPYSGNNIRVMGYDNFSEPDRRAAVELARDTGKVSITGKIRLVQGVQAGAPGLVMYAPIYRTNAIVNVPEERRRALLGFAYSALRAPGLMRDIPFDAMGIRVAIYDGAVIASDRLLYDSAAAGVKKEPATQPLYTRFEQMNMLGRTWMLSASSLPAFEATRGIDRERLVLASGIALSFALTAIAWLLSTQRSRALSLARAMTEQLQASERKSRLLASLVEQSGDAMFSHDLTGIVTTWNDAAVRLTGIPSEEAVGRSLRELSLVRNDGNEAEARQRYASMQSESYETSRAGSNGEVVNLLVSVSPHFDAEGAHVGRIISMRDITPRKRAEEALRESREQLGLALQGSGLALFDWDVRTGKVQLSDLWNVMLGGGPQPVVMMIGTLEKQMHPDDIAVFRKRLHDVLRGRSSYYHVEHRVRTHAGDWKWIANRAKVVERDRNGRATRVTGTCADISARKEVERVKEDFVATVNHELRTPLTAVIGALDMLRIETGGKLGGEAAMYLGMAHKNGERLAALVNDILDMEKLASGRMEFICTPVDLVPFLQRALELNAAYAKRFNVELRLDPGTANVRALADERRLMQVITNLLSNAAKFSPENATVRVGATSRDGRCRISVSDEGPGIPKAFRHLVFERFAQADNSNTRMKSGTGLGLAISKGIIEKMNGRISFDSIEGRGATFHVDLPLQS